MKLDGRESPADPMSPLMAGAVQCHELFVSYRQAGFKAEEALYLVRVGQILAAMIRGQASS